jgi:hypothetical protein
MVGNGNKIIEHLNKKIKDKIQNIEVYISKKYGLSNVNITGYKLLRSRRYY